jgi:hypothetical protein
MSFSPLATSFCWIKNFSASAKVSSASVVKSSWKAWEFQFSVWWRLAGRAQESLASKSATRH